MTREQALTNLRKFEGIAASVGIEMLDDENNLKGVLDAALRSLGIAEGDLLTVDTEASLATSYLALLDYNLLGLLQLKHIAGAVDLSVTMQDRSYSKQRSQIWDHLQTLLDKAEKRVIALGFPVTASDFIYGELDVGYTEPSWEWEL